MKKRYFNRLHILITAALLLAPAITTAQSIKEWPYTDNFSLVRTISDTSYMVFSEDGGKYFYLLTPSGFLTMYKYINNETIFINDFEISKDTVYFCGYQDTAGTKHAVLGYFPLNNFPVGDINYDKKTDFLEFKKLDVFRIGGKIHAAMTAIERNKASTIVDAFYVTGTTWYYSYLVGDALKQRFDDVVVVNTYPTSYVAFSSRDLTLNNYPRVWIFTLPIAPNLSLLYTPYICHRLYVVPKSEVLLESMEGWVASAFMIENDTILVNRYAPTGYDRSVRIKAYPNMTLKDMQYNDNLAFTLDVLATETTATTINSQIYHVHEYYFDTNMAMYMHFYGDEDINSLALISPVTHSYMASGHNVSNQLLRVYNYFNNGSWGCSSRKNASPFNHKYDYDNPDIDISNKIENPEFQQLKHSIGGISIETIFGTKTNINQ